MFEVDFVLRESSQEFFEADLGFEARDIDSET